MKEEEKKGSSFFKCLTGLFVYAIAFSCGNTPINEETFLYFPHLSPFKNYNWQSVTLSHQILSVWIPYSASARYLLYPQTKYLSPHTYFGVFFVYKICLQLLVLFCAVVLMFLFLYLIFNCVVLCFVHLKTECVQFYLKKVLLVSFLWLGQLSNDNQKNYLNGCVWMWITLINMPCWKCIFWNCTETALVVWRKWFVVLYAC